MLDLLAFLLLGWMLSAGLVLVQRKRQQWVAGTGQDWKSGWEECQEKAPVEDADVVPDAECVWEALPGVRS